MRNGKTAQAVAEPEIVEPVRVLFPSPIGQLAVEITGETITGVVIDPSKEQKQGYVSFEEVDGSDFLEEVFGRLSEYFAGARKSLDIRFDLKPTGIRGFPRRILREAARIPFGRTRTYRQIAEKAGQPDAYRVVLATLVANPIPIVIPCHRVVTNKSGIGSYVAGQDRKRWLLSMEKEAVATDVVS
jgi:O-6-methylguanine DNA methyltransferase